MGEGGLVGLQLRDPRSPSPLLLEGRGLGEQRQIDQLRLSEGALTCSQDELGVPWGLPGCLMIPHLNLNHPLL